MSEQETIDWQVTLDQRGLRLDQAVTDYLQKYSRSRVSDWIKKDLVTLNGRVCKAKYKLHGDEQVSITIPATIEVESQAEPIPLDIVYQDDDLIVVNKPAGLVVHPAPGNLMGTMQNALLHHDPALNLVPRAGIVHRLDKMTTGLLVVARTVEAHCALVAQLQNRAFSREYECVVSGVMTGGGTIDAPIGRQESDRKKMCVTDKNSKEAITHFRVIHRFRAHTHVAVKLETGRTHQIRVHMAHKRFPIIGDKTYGRGVRLPKQADAETINFLQQFGRQALHAKTLGLEQPITGEMLEWTAPLPDDFAKLLAVLKADSDEHSG
ncbi:MAG: 23S rRNA pseudouridine(1911/1915/1917) synthase RluD [Methylococcales bacterium]|jgi:23S rRNA pseudouridine1911/1915/1917 synthase|nr:23S rRNA pseudouridine(1911/1915/1917) synthase RluD [Methylococcales bacterium]MBT7443066.1 23S rRNA pseudouridine(1911/1915/1917) synthase RluD [Methylococcales bacterium]